MQGHHSCHLSLGWLPSATDSGSMGWQAGNDPAAPRLPGGPRRYEDFDAPAWRLRGLRGNGCWLPLYCGCLPVLLTGTVVLFMITSVKAYRLAK